MRPLFAEEVLRIAYAADEAERRTLKMLLALSLVALGCNVRRMLDMPKAPEPAINIAEQVARWRDNPNW